MVQFQFHGGQRVQCCVVCGARRKLTGLWARGVKVGVDPGGFWEIFPGVRKCSGHSWA